MNRFFNNLQKNNSQILYLFFPFLFKFAVVLKHIVNSFFVVWKCFCQIAKPFSVIRCKSYPMRLVVFKGFNVHIKRLKIDSRFIFQMLKNIKSASIYVAKMFVFCFRIAFIDQFYKIPFLRNYGIRPDKSQAHYPADICENS